MHRAEKPREYYQNDQLGTTIVLKMYGHWHAQFLSLQSRNENATLKGGYAADL